MQAWNWHIYLKSLWEMVSFTYVQMFRFKSLEVFERILIKVDSFISDFDSVPKWSTSDFVVIKFKTAALQSL